MYEEFSHQTSALGKMVIFPIVLSYNSCFTDVIFLVENKEVCAHKLVLAERSPVFSAMFRSDMIEKNETLFKINDININIFKEMIEFMYSNECSNLPSMSKEILRVSDFYLVDDLKAMAERVLAKGISKQNYVELFDLADRYYARHLKGCIINFLNSKKFEGIGKAQKWMPLIQIEPSLLARLFEYKAE